MTKLLAIVELADPAVDPMDPANLVAITAIPDFPIDVIPNGNALIAHWNAGIQARYYIEDVAENFYQIFRKSGIIDENGLHIKEYTPGSLFRFLDKNQEMMMPPSFRESATGMLVSGSIKSATMLLGKKGKEIDMDWSFLMEHGKPFIETIIRQIMQSPDRRAIVEPLLIELMESKNTPSTLPTS
jgi:hypothetical protein